MLLITKLPKTKLHLGEKAIKCKKMINYLKIPIILPNEQYIILDLLKAIEQNITVT